MLIATEAQAKQMVVLASGEECVVAKGDWLIHQGDAIIDTATTNGLLTRYDLVQEAGLQLTQTDCALLERTTGLGSTRSVPELVQAVERLATLRIGEVRIDFTPGQLTEIHHRAQKRGITVEQEISRIVDRIKEELFYRS